MPPPLGERALGLCAPASHFKREDFEAGVRLLEARGFRLKHSPRLFARKGFFAGDDRSRAAELHELFADPEVGAVMAVRGGWGSLRLMEHLDFEHLRRHPKPLVGFSDLTTLLAALNERAGLVALHGPTLTSLPRLDAASVEALCAALREGRFAPLSPDKPRLIRAKRVSGRLVGGNLATLVSLLGTPYAPRTDGGLLLLEELREKPYRLDRMLTQLRLSGLLEGVRAVLLGDFVLCGRPALAVVLAALEGLRVPVVTGYPCGHGGRNVVLPLGARVTLEEGGTLRVCGRGV
jgi:muramoyltetrapeptide carboxypeptidase